MHKGNGFSPKLFEKAYFICELTGLVIVRSASSDIWKAAQVSKVFNGVAETIVGSLLCCGGGIVWCLFNLLYYVIL